MKVLKIEISGNHSDADNLKEYLYGFEALLSDYEVIEIRYRLSNGRWSSQKVIVRRIG